MKTSKFTNSPSIVTYLFALLACLLLSGELHAQVRETATADVDESAYWLQLQAGVMTFGAPSYADVLAPRPFLTVGYVGRIPLLSGLGTYWRVSTGMSPDFSLYNSSRANEPFFLLDMNLFVDFNERGRIPELGPALSAGISIVKPLTDTYPLIDHGLSRARWSTSNWVDAIHVFVSFIFRIHPSMIELYARFAVTRSVSWDDSYPTSELSSRGTDRPFFFGISYAYLIAL
ncbi:MAG: hypothetical protein HY962_06330 [Ignavibacteriae bacterium]|nr:hypothetical protein [Ignavibacteriota bacterium]